METIYTKETKTVNIFKISIHNCYTHEKTLLCITLPVLYTGIHLIYMCYTYM